MSYPTPSPQALNVRDASLAASTSLPNGASTTVNGSAIDLGTITGISARSERMEAILSAPTLTPTMLPDTRTMTYSLEASNDSAFGSGVVTIAGSCIVQTGASGAGAAAATFRAKIPSNCPRYLRAKAVSGASVTDSSSLKMKLELLF